MDNRFTKLRRAIYHTQDEKRRFRAILLNAVMATDLMDKKRQASDAARWEQAFGAGDTQETHPVGTGSAETHQRNHRATLVMEEVIRASNISHTMQHFEVYRKWNALLFREEYQAYIDGRIDTNPSDYWYQQELDFFDHTVIPLARRLQESGVFGLKSGGNELLEFAVRNRSQWEDSGHNLVQEYREEYDGFDKTGSL